ncbi:unnamed protein product [Symbiodinium sp. CCMP2592]|nr:unnamed protein product [Symbiodinium sp. CCMP2592]CAE7439490.1 unnamed protein product [Symbiodinium sp. CCMP2592]
MHLDALLNPDGTDDLQYCIGTEQVLDHRLVADLAHQDTVVSVLRTRRRVRVRVCVPKDGQSYNGIMASVVELDDVDVMLPCDCASLRSLMQPMETATEGLDNTMLGGAAKLALKRCLSVKQIARRQLEEFPAEGRYIFLNIVFADWGPRVRAHITGEVTMSLPGSTSLFALRNHPEPSQLTSEAIHCGRLADLMLMEAHADR